VVETTMVVTPLELTREVLGAAERQGAAVVETEPVT